MKFLLQILCRLYLHLAYLKFLRDVRISIQIYVSKICQKEIASTVRKNVLFIKLIGTASSVYGWFLVEPWSEDRKS